MSSNAPDFPDNDVILDENDKPQYVEDQEAPEVKEQRIRNAMALAEQEIRKIFPEGCKDPDAQVKALNMHCPKGVWHAGRRPDHKNKGAFRITHFIEREVSLHMFKLIFGNNWSTQISDHETMDYPVDNETVVQAQVDCLVKVKYVDGTTQKHQARGFGSAKQSSKDVSLAYRIAIKGAQTDAFKTTLPLFGQIFVPPSGDIEFEIDATISPQEAPDEVMHGTPSKITNQLADIVPFKIYNIDGEFDSETRFPGQYAKNLSKTAIDLCRDRECLDAFMNQQRAEMHRLADNEQYQDIYVKLATDISNLRESLPVAQKKEKNATVALLHETAPAIENYSHNENSKPPFDEDPILPEDDFLDGNMDDFNNINEESGFAENKSPQESEEKQIISAVSEGSDDDAALLTEPEADAKSIMPAVTVSSANRETPAQKLGIPPEQIMQQDPKWKRLVAKYDEMINPDTGVPENIAEFAEMALQSIPRTRTPGFVKMLEEKYRIAFTSILKHDSAAYMKVIEKIGERKAKDAAAN